MLELSNNFFAPSIPSPDFLLVDFHSDSHIPFYHHRIKDIINELDRASLSYGVFNTFEYDPVIEQMYKETDLIEQIVEDIGGYFYPEFKENYDAWKEKGVRGYDVFKMCGSGFNKILRLALFTHATARSNVDFALICDFSTHFHKSLISPMLGFLQKYSRAKIIIFEPYLDLWGYDTFLSGAVPAIICHIDANGKWRQRSEFTKDYFKITF